MLIERNLSLALIGVAAALSFPEFAAAGRPDGYAPGGALLLAAALATAGIFFGTLLAADGAARRQKWFLLGCWGLIAIVFSVGLGRGALRGDGIWRLLLYGSAALAPAATYLLTLVKARE